MLLTLCGGCATRVLCNCCLYRKPLLPMTKKMENYEVIIVGGGPVGATLAVFLASYGVSTLVLERDAENPRIPRAFSFDDETMRMLQSFGIRQRIVDEACHEPACVTYHATAAPGSPQFLRLESTRDLGNGYGALQFFHQPYLERILGEEFASRGLSSGNSAFRRGIEVTRVECFEEESPGHCKVYYRPAGDTTTEEQCTSAKFVVGCDGKTGIVRNSVLAGKVDMEGDRYPEAWVTVSAIVNSPPKDFILFHPPYNLSADNVYALFFPPEFRFICDPARPSISSRVGPPKDRQYRWEWMVMPGDHRLASSLGKDHGGTRDEASIEVVKEIMRRHGMLRTQLSNGVVVEYPWESLDIVRNQVYRFDMRIAKEWRFGRLFLAGDSAHTMPPFVSIGPSQT